jgi:hypothetical protein
LRLDRSAAETWEVHYLQDPQTGQRQKVGHRQVVARQVRENGAPVRQVESREQMRVLRFGEPAEVSIHVSSVETLEGELLRFAYQIDMGSSTQQVSGAVVDNELHFQVRVDGLTMTRQRAWPPDCGGPFAVEDSLRRRPMQPGEQRQITSLQPLPILGNSADIHLTGDVELVAEQWQVTHLPSGPLKLLRIPAVFHLPGPVAVRSTLWADERGTIHKTQLDALHQETFRTTRELALSQDDTLTFDFGLDVRVPLDRPLPMAHATSQVEYDVTLEGRDPSHVFARGPTQDVQSLSATTARIVVHAIRPDRRAPLAAPTRRPADGDLKPSPLIQSDDPQVMQLASAVAADESDPWRVVVALEALVHDRILLTDFSQVLTSAAEVARNQRGDCTEYAVLLAALCRARLIPARVAIGLVYSDQHTAFLYHMWNEVWIGEQWIPLDATLGLGGIGAAHLKLDDSDLQGAAAYTSLLGILDVVGRLQIKVLRSQ